MPAATRTTDGLLLGIYAVIARRYDLVNFIISWGQDSRWRRETARLCLAGQPMQVLDLGCGSGDLTLELARLSPITGYVKPGRVQAERDRHGLQDQASPGKCRRSPFC
jgi:ubiquinone/menaquinone biosynthesis C-methylase UbiE